MTEAGAKIRVLVVDDSPLVLTMLTRIIEADPGMTVVGTARDGAEGLAKAAELQPDVICTDLQMPVMGGLEFTRRVMSAQPMPILVVSVAVRPDQSDNIFRLLEAGAVDVFAKPVGGFRVDSVEAEALRRRVRLVAGVHVFKRREHGPSPAAAVHPAVNGAPPELVVIGASTGGPKALATILRALPADYALPIVVVQHISRGFADSLVAWLAEVAPMAVRFAQTGRRPEPGVVHFAPEGHDIALEPGGRLLTPAAAAGVAAPSVDTLFSSAAEALGSRCVGVLLSGMGTDGLAGMQRLAAAGAMTIAQDEATSVVFGMPGAVVRAGAAREVLPIGVIGPYLAELGDRKASSGPKGALR